MAQNRAAKSGIALEAQLKCDSKYDPDLAAQVMCWIQGQVPEESFSTDGSMDNVAATLKDGYLLQMLARNLNARLNKPSNKVPKKQKLAFKQMEEIGQFLAIIGAAPYSVPAQELFQTCDLYESQNLNAVITCLAALARKCQSHGLEGFGPKEAEQNKRDFTDEQLKAGKGIIGLQMGSNRGASKAGMREFGRRHIVD